MVLFLNIDSDQANAGFAMLAESPSQKSESPKIPGRERNRSKFLVLFIALAVVLVGFFLLDKKSWAVRGFSDRGPRMVLVSVDQGDIVSLVVENGTVESANNTTVRCEVEAIVGKVGGSTPQGMGGGGAGRTAGGGAPGGGGGGQASPAGAGTGTTAKSKGTTKSGGGAASSAGVGGSGASRSITSASADATNTASGTATSSKPTIRSFTYQVARYSPMRGSTVKAATTNSQQQGTSTGGAAGGGGRGGGGRGGGGRRGGGGMGQEEKPGATRIVWIIPEGSQVKKGDLVCELDAATFQDELQAQQIRYVQAQAFVEQVQSILDVNEITFREYRDGIFPQDRQLIRQYIETCLIQKEQAERTVTWSREVTSKGFRAPAQLTADELNYQKTVIQLREAEGMLTRLEKYTAPKLLKSLQANLEAIRADKLAQRIAFGLEENRVRDLERNIKNCKLAAPHDGIVVYATQTNPWGRVTDRIEEGATVRQSQPIFTLPDPLRMRVKAKINETKVNLVRTGQKATIIADAFPGHRLSGVVAEVNPISVAGGMVSDVRVYYANIDIQDGFAELRPGLSVEVLFHPEPKINVKRVPLDAVRWVNNQAFVAFEKPETADSKGALWAWRKVRLGVSDTEHAEVIDGLEVGDRIVADPTLLPDPLLEIQSETAPRVVSAP